MLITFKSKASGDVIMFGDVAERLLLIMGKSVDTKQGIVTVEQLPDAIRRLRSAIEEDKTERAPNKSATTSKDDETEEKTGMDAPVDLAQRAWPLLEALEFAARDGVPVIWESS